MLGDGKPSWLKIPYVRTTEFDQIKAQLKTSKLVTVCEEAHCPNLNECWSKGTATFMVLGDTCTRGCRFCNIKTGAKGQEIDPLEPMKVASAIRKWGLKYVVITSVDRDELPDQGATHFAQVIRAVKNQSPQTKIEVLIPDFRGEKELIKKIVDAKPDVIAHNIETVQRLQNKVRDLRANYDQSLSVLKTVKELDASIYTKSSIMLGLGEEKDEVLKAMEDLRAIGTDFFTLGQYLQPSDWHVKVKEFIHPNLFEEYKKQGLQKGFLFVASGPYVRSSYKAEAYFETTHEATV